jgi:shikimate kinase
MNAQTKSIMSRLDRPIALVGLMGSGKSMLGKKLARQMGIPFVDSDQAIEDTAGLKIVDIFDIAGNDKFRELEQRVIAEQLAGRPMVLATGGGAICNAGTADLLLDKSVVVWLHASPETLLARIGNTATRPLLAGDDPLGTLHRLNTERRKHYEKAHIHLNTAGMNGDKALVALVDSLDSFLAVT